MYADPRPVERMTHVCENITSPPLRWRAVTIDQELRTILQLCNESLTSRQPMP